MKVFRYWLLFLCAFSLAQARAPKRFREFPAPPMHTLTAFQTPVIYSGAGGSITNNTAQVWGSSPHSSMITAGSANVVLYLQTLAAPVNICADTFMRVTLFSPNKANTTNLARTDLYLANNATNYIVYEFGSTATQGNVRDTNLTRYGYWSHYHLMRRNFTTVGAFDCAAVDTVIISLQATAGNQDTISVGEVATFGFRLPKAVLIIHADDGYSNWADSGGLSKLDSLGYRSTLLINPSSQVLGTPGFLSERRLDSIYRRGLIDVANHGWSHDTIPPRSPDSVLNIIRKGRDWIRAKGYKGYSLYAYPFGMRDRDSDSTLRASGMVDFVRPVINQTQGEPHVYNNPFSVRVALTLGGIVIDSTIAKGVVDNLIANRSAGIFLFHKLCDSCTDDVNAWQKPQWFALMNYVKTKVGAGTLQVMSWSDYLEQYGGGMAASRRGGAGR